MTKPLSFKCLLIAFMLCVSVVTQAAPRPNTNAAKVAILVEEAFLALNIDTGLEDADIEDAVRAAFRAGASPNARDEYGKTLLLQAIENNHLSIVRLILVNKADVNMPDRDSGDTPLILAARTKDFNSGEAEPSTESAREPVSATPSITIINALLQKRADPNRRNKAGDTALIIAAANGYDAVVAALLKGGANFRLKDKQGYTALKWASTPVPPGSVIVMGAFPYLTEEDAKDSEKVEKAMRENEMMQQRIARAEEKRLVIGREKAKRLLQAVGAKE